MSVQSWGRGCTASLTPAVPLSGHAAQEVSAALGTHHPWHLERRKIRGEEREKLISHIMKLPHFVARLFPHEQFVFI